MTDKTAARQALERVAAIHQKSDHQRWTGFPRADRQEYYCLEDQQTWPCRTQLAMIHVSNETESE